MDSTPEYAAATDVEFADKDTIFQKQDLTLKIGERKLFVRKDDFKQISKVFEAMLTNDCKEKNSDEIEFIGKDYKTFVRFLRVSHPGLKYPFEDEWVHDVLPLIDEYLAEDARREADNYFVKAIKREQCILSSTLIDNLITAEKYQLSMLLDDCIILASEITIAELLSLDKFNEVSFETRYKICVERLKKSDKLNNSAYSHTDDHSSDDFISDR